MSHLTDEQLETLLRGEDLYQDHLGRCEQCRLRLAAMQALAERLRLALSQVSPSAALSQRIREQLSDKAKPGERIQGVGIRRRLRVWTASLSAAAAVLVVVSILAFSLSPSTALATQATLAEIHALNAAGQHEFWAETEPNVLASRYAERLGFVAQLPCPCETLKLCSCCIKPCINEDAVLGTYVADTDQGIITVAVLKDTPESLGKGDTIQEGDRRFYQSRFGPCHMVATRINGQSYCAVGKMGFAYLRDLLVQLMPAASRNRHTP